MLSSFQIIDPGFLREEGEGLDGLREAGNIIRPGYVLRKKRRIILK